MNAVKPNQATNIAILFHTGLEILRKFWRASRCIHKYRQIQSEVYL